MPRKLCGSVRWSRHRKDGARRKLCGSVRWCRHRKDGVPRKLCGSVRWSRHRKDGVPRKLCLTHRNRIKGGVPKNLCGSARCSRHRKDGVPNIQGKEIDETLAPLLPLFHCDNYCLPFRILREEEVASLSGLHNFWTRTSIEDAEALPEHLERNYCGNCFHPDLISSALGNNTVLRDWVIGHEEGPSTLVAGQSEAFQVFSSLCDKVEAEAVRKRRKEKLAIDRTLPPFQVVSCVSQQQPAHEVSVQQHVLPPLLGGIPKVRVTKAERRVQQCIDAALHKLEESQCLALKEKGLGRLFDGLRAPRFIAFQFAEYAASVIGEDLSRLRQFGCRFPHEVKRFPIRIINAGVRDIPSIVLVKLV